MQTKSIQKKSKLAQKFMGALGEEDKEKVISQCKATIEELKVKAANGCESSYNELATQISNANGGKKVDHVKLKAILEKIKTH